MIEIARKDQPGRKRIYTYRNGPIGCRYFPPTRPTAVAPKIASAHPVISEAPPAIAVIPARSGFPATGMGPGAVALLLRWAFSGSRSHDRATVRIASMNF